MKKSEYENIERYMLECMKDSAHDKEHIYRVLYMALDIAKYEENVDKDTLIAACLLHDIGREEQFKNPAIDHAKAGSKKAYDFLVKSGWSDRRAWHVRECILTHRFRSDHLPKSIEAQILFDADKLDVAGTLGIARTLVYTGQVSEPLYSVDEKGNVLDGESDRMPSFFQEYKFKLENIYDKFFTQRGKQIAKERQESAVSFYNSMLSEVRSCYSCGRTELSALLAGLC
ncbi:MAG: HD domain-containing protein [Clostridiales bacterium]|nr:HD domain-containing protein [Clostridiales bacterium]